MNIGFILIEPLLIITRYLENENNKTLINFLPINEYEETLSPQEEL